MAVNPGNKDSNVRKKFAAAMGKIATASVTTGIGLGDAPGGMFDAALTAKVGKPFNDLYTQTRQSARDLLEDIGESVNYAAFLDTRVKLESVANQIETAVETGEFDTGASPSASDPYVEEPYDYIPEYDPTLDPMIAATDLTEIVITDEEEGLSMEAKVGIGLGAATLVAGLLVVLARR